MTTSQESSLPGHSRPTIVRWGDSLTQQGDYARLSALTRAAVVNAGVGGETSTTIAARMGAIPIEARFSAGARTGERSLSFVEPLGFRPLMQGSGTASGLLTGWLNDTPGTIFRCEDVSGDASYVFIADDERGPVGSSGQFVPHVDDAYLSAITVLWVGRNNFHEPDTVVRDVAAMITRLHTDRFLVLTVLHGGDDPLSSATGRAITAINDAISTTWAEHVLDVDRALRRTEAGAVGESPVVPARFRKDSVHLNPAGQTAVSELIADACHRRAWV